MLVQSYQEPAVVAINNRLLLGLSGILATAGVSPCPSGTAKAERGGIQGKKIKAKASLF